MYDHFLNYCTWLLNVCMRLIWIFNNPTDYYIKCLRFTYSDVREQIGFDFDFIRYNNVYKQYENSQIIDKQ